MKNYAALGAFLALAQQAMANLDVVSLTATSEAWIKEATATLVLPKTPESITGDVSFWSAIMMENEASFLQGVTENAPQGLGYCENLGSQWCNFAYCLVGSNPTVGDPVKASAGSKVTTHYKYNSETTMWDQDVYVDDELVSNVSTSKGQHGWLFYISVECASGTCDTAPAHSWEDVSIVLNEANPNFKHEGSWDQGATGGEMSTTDGGKTWNFSTLKIPALDVQYNA
ncbi:uncharacterized protein K452DRAFT_297624 [Aplosporella prunicola CBS 121167]|uniref:Uncharacterized protein n=1 Tax=Aplosporella prunicola CBS 121167 TaxID=1176127 RepID=A0A6A6BE03_9PEZI|nr:uncharacterized protein K452DRAFT_297624 [Aplosporella prunicola CBS 121167]KAF2142306.1 hypothetical protein K452DRAFT_297624 [Aplosporella prunicola CBS 121167]